MSNDKLSVVPFGKYKGQPVEVMAQDQAYCEWLAGQDWFRTRYTAIHTLIINNFTEAHETPEHNALQALFTDGAWVKAFVWAYLGPEWWPKVLKDEIDRTHRACREAIAAKEKEVVGWETDLNDHQSRTVDEYRLRHVKLVRDKLEVLHKNYDRHIAWLSEKKGNYIHVYIQLFLKNLWPDAFFPLLSVV
jgi:hypothetical protein